MGNPGEGNRLSPPNFVFFSVMKQTNVELFDFSVIGVLHFRIPRTNVAAVIVFGGLTGRCAWGGGVVLDWTAIKARPYVCFYIRNRQAKAFTLAQKGGDANGSCPASLTPAFGGAPSVNESAKVSSSPCLADTDAFLPILSELSSLPNAAYSSVSHIKNHNNDVLMFCPHVPSGGKALIMEREVVGGKTA